MKILDTAVRYCFSIDSVGQTVGFLTSFSSVGRHSTDQMAARTTIEREVAMNCITIID